MPKFRILIHGANFHMRDIDSKNVEPMGFYVTAFVESSSAEAAENASVKLIRGTSKLREVVLNPPADPPRLFAEEIEELSAWPAGCAIPLSGFSFFKETETGTEEGAAPPQSPGT